MSDLTGADNTQIGDTTIFDTGYFDQEYKMQAIWLGLLWWFMGMLPMIIIQAWRPGSIDGYWFLTQGEWHGLSVMQWAYGSSFGALGTFWLLAYIKAAKNRIMQKIYYRAIAWIIPLSWVFALWVFIAMLVGGSQVGGDMGRDIGIAFLFWVLVAGCEGLAWFLAPRATKFYKWSEEDWWNYDGEEVPKVWPSQLGDFVAY